MNLTLLSSPCGGGFQDDRGNFRRWLHHKQHRNGAFDSSYAFVLSRTLNYTVYLPILGQFRIPWIERREETLRQIADSLLKLSLNTMPAPDGIPFHRDMSLLKEFLPTSPSAACWSW